MRRIWRFAQEHIVETVLALLMTALIAMFVHALTDRGELRRRVNDVERECNLNGGAVVGLRDALETRTSTLQRELDQRTSAMQRELVQVCDRMNERILSFEEMIDRLIMALRQNGVTPSRGALKDTEG